MALWGERCPKTLTVVGVHPDGCVALKSFPFAYAEETDRLGRVCDGRPCMIAQCRIGGELCSKEWRSKDGRARALESGLNASGRVTNRGGEKKIGKNYFSGYQIGCAHSEGLIMHLLSWPVILIEKIDKLNNT